MIKHIIDYIIGMFTSKDTFKSIGLVHFTWIVGSHSVLYQSINFLIDDNDNRKVIIHGDPPEGCKTENHLIYHRVVVPFINKLPVDGMISFETKQDAIKAVDLLMSIVTPSATSTHLTEPSIKSSDRVIEDNVIYVNFNNNDS